MAVCPHDTTQITGVMYHAFFMPEDGGLYCVKSFKLPYLCLEKIVKDLPISSLLPHPIICRRSMLT